MASKNIIHHYSSGGVIVKDNEVLIIESLQPAKEYSFPKGSIEPGEHSRDTAVREILEETGYHATILGFIDTLIYEFSTGDGHVVKEVSYYTMLCLLIVQYLDKNNSFSQEKIYAPCGSAYQKLFNSSPTKTRDNFLPWQLKCIITEATAVYRLLYGVVREKVIC